MANQSTSNVFLVEQVTQVARIALKNLVAKGLLPWPQLYSKEFWDIAISEDFSEVARLRDQDPVLTPELLQEFMDETNDILGEVKDTVEEFVQVTKDHVSEVHQSLKTMDQKDEGRLFHDDIESLRKKNRNLEERAKETEKKIKEQARVIAELRAKVRVDELTGLLNRRAFEKDIAKEVSRVKRYKYPLSLIMCDIDHFKNVNDTYGHTIGDKVLKHLAQIWKKSVREIDAIYRYGGEEFLVLTPHTSKEDAFKLAERLRQTVGHYRFVVEPPNKYIKITVSFGVTEIKADEPVLEALERVDKALYKAKESGRNCTVML